MACALFAVWLEKCKSENRQPSLAVRTFDLKSAYRQVGLSSSGRSYAYIRVYNPESKTTALFQSTVLPFGAVRSVHSFLRLARSLWWVGVVGGSLLWTSFYDDFICCSTSEMATNAEQTVAALFKLTGWLFAEAGEKCSPFGPCCEALGVIFDVSLSGAGLVNVANTSSRIEELKLEIESVLAGGKLTMKAAQRLRGRMQFADSQLYGKTGRRCMNVLGEFAEGVRWKLTSKDKFFLDLFKTMLVEAVPRPVRARPRGNVLVFTDACYERDDKF